LNVATQISGSVMFLGDFAHPAKFGSWVRRVLSPTALLTCLSLSAHALAAALAEDGAPAAPPAAEAPRELPAAVWRLPGQVFVVELAVDPALGARQFAAMEHYVIGVAALPVTLVQPQVAVALPFYLLIGATLQAVFNARADTLARVLVAEPLPGAVVEALRAQWRQTSPPWPALQVTLRLAGYGLATKTGRKLEAFDSAEDLCLVADGRLEVLREGSAPLAEDIAIGPRSATRDAPPPLCAPLSRWAAEEGRLLRQATREMAELLAAFIVDRAERQP
jgi:hypothetical protein